MGAESKADNIAKYELKLFSFRKCCKTVKGNHLKTHLRMCCFFQQTLPNTTVCPFLSIHISNRYTFIILMNLRRSFSRSWAFSCRMIMERTLRETRRRRDASVCHHVLQTWLLSSRRGQRSAEGTKRSTVVTKLRFGAQAYQ